MNSESVITAPGESFINLTGMMRSPEGIEVHVTDGTNVMNFDDVKNLLAGKPLRRPGRTKPISEEKAQDRLL